jgi:tetratricopeptide (TPR) repeat protein
VAVLLACAGAGGALAADSVTTRAGDHGRFGRLVFDWKAPVEYAARTEGGRLVVEFERPMTTSFGAVLGRLRNYVTDAKLEDGGRRAVFTLTRQFAHRTFVNETSVVVDLVGRAGAAAGGATANARPLDVRFGDHVGFSRLVFDWTRPVDYKILRDEAAATIAFSHPARIDLAKLQADLPEHVTAVELGPSDPGLAVRLTLSESARLRHFRSSTKVVVDVLRPAGAAAVSEGADRDPPRAPPPLPLVRPKPVPKTEAEGPEADREAPAQPRDDSAAAATRGMPEAKEGTSEREQAGDGQPAQPDPAAAAAALEPSAGTVPRADADPAARQAVDAGKAPQADAGPADQVEAGKAPRADAGPATRQAADDGPADQADAGKAPQADAGPATRQAADEGPADQVRALVVGAEAKDETLRLRFDWPEPVAVAAYRRAGALWVVFDREGLLDLTAVRAAAPDLVTQAQQIPHRTATVLRLKAKPGINPSVERDGLAWVVAFEPQGLQPDAAIRVDAEPLAVAGPRIFLSVANAGRKVEVRDPEVGDTIVVLPLAATGHGVDGRREYAQFDLLATAQGIVIDPRAEDLLVHIRDTGVEITSAAGLYLSDWSPPARGQARPRAALRPRPARPARGLFDFEGWLGPDASDFSVARQAFQQAVVEADKQGLNLARLELARFYFAHNFITEALGLLRTIDRDDLHMAEDPKYRALRGACHYLVGDYKAAAEDLFDSGLDGEPEGMLWRGLLAASQRQWSTAARSFAKVGETIQFYPQKHKIKFGLLAAATALATGELGAAKIYLDFVEKNAPDEAAQSRAKYLLGWWLEKLGDREKAFAIWDEVAQGPDRGSEARARFAKVTLRFDDEELSVPATIEELERLRFAWRGDDFEFDLLHRLGELHLSAGNYLRGLTTLKQAVTHFPEFEESRLIAQKMSDAFVELYSEGAADSLPPITALAIYREFRELTPTGETGDEIVRDLAERLVAVDLLDQAAELLDGQVKYRNKGPEKSRVGMRLAMIRLLNKKPELALEALRASSEPGLPEELVAERRLLEARALSGLGRHDEALALIRRDPSPAADLLRADIHWGAREWARAARALARLVDDEVPEDSGLGEARGLTVLRLAVALSLSEDRAALTGLRERYGPAMEGTPFGDHFRVITSAPAGDVTTVAAIAARVAEVDWFKAFMASYRERLQGAEVAAVN